MTTLLDLFCSAGGASMGYSRAGFDVTGVDINPQPHYPFEFIQGDALEYVREYGHEYDAIAASPPCQMYSITRNAVSCSAEHPRLIEPVRESLALSGKPYVIENVAGAPLIDPITLCGSMFGLRVRRHRLFESNVSLRPLSCRHDLYTDKPYKIRMASYRQGFRYSSFVPAFGGLQLLFPSLCADKCLPDCKGHGSTALETQVIRDAMDIQWMTKRELNQAIPPAYTEYLGQQLMSVIEVT